MLDKILLYLISITFVSSEKIYVAQFGISNDTGVYGTVKVDNGQVTVQIDLSEMPDFGIDGVTFTDCINGGLSYHIHAKWEYNDTMDRIGSECGGTFTSGHIDPWQACGSASGNKYCKTASNTYEYACIPANSSFYIPDFGQDPFSVEVGDWSNKYGSIVLDSDNKYGPMTNSSFYEVEPGELEGLSVVFHCNNGDRAFCAPFEESPDNTESVIPSQPNDKTVVAYFKGLSDESMIKLEPDGTVEGTIDATKVFSPTNARCSKYEYTIFNPSSSTFDYDECDGSTNGQYDPTNQCLPWSDSKYCVDGSLCDDPNYSYDCDFSSDRYSCAPGDLSGKFGTIDPTVLLTISESGPTTLIPPTDQLIGKIIGITCPYDDDNTDIEFLACGEIVEYVTTTTETPGAAKQILVIIPLIISSLVVFALN